MKKIISILTGIAVILAMMPSMAFAGDTTMQDPYRYNASDWTGGDGYGLVEGTGNAYTLKGNSAETRNDGGYMVGPYTKAGIQSFANGNLVQEINIEIDPARDDFEVENGVMFALSSALNDTTGEYAAEMSYVLQKTEDAVKVLGTDIALTNKGIYTFRIENIKGDDGNVTVQLKVYSEDGKEVGESGLQQLTSETNKALDRTRYLWLSSINVTDGIKVFKEMPVERTMQEPYLYNASDWTGGTGYGQVEGTGNAYTLTGNSEETRNDGGYMVGPFTKAGTQSFADGNLVQEINIEIDPARDDFEVKNGVMFALSSALNDADRNYAAEMSYVLQKTEDAVKVLGTDIELANKGIYTFRIENIKDKYDNVTVQLKVYTEDGDLVGESAVQSLASVNDITGHRYLWLSSINVTDGIKVFKEMPVERTMQDPYRYNASDWTGGDGYGLVEGTGNAYTLKGNSAETRNDGGYMVGPYTKAGIQSFADGNLVQEINIEIDPARDDFEVENGVMFALSSALNDGDGNYAAEMSYVLQKTEDAVKVLGTDIELTDKGIYTFRIENIKDKYDNVTVQLKVYTEDGDLVGASDVQSLASVNDITGHRYLWLSSINVTDGIKVYKEIPAAPVISGGGAVVPPAAQKPAVEAGEGADVVLSEDGTIASITVADGYELEDVILNGVSLGKVTEVKNLKTGDKIVVTAAKKTVEEDIAASVKATSIRLNSKKGKGYVKLSWIVSGYEDLDGYDVYRGKSRTTLKRWGGNTKPVYRNAKGLKKGTTYYYKVGGYKIIDGKKVYTKWSNINYRKAI